MSAPATPSEAKMSEEWENWWEHGEYDGTSCTHCGRERVMIADAPDGAERRVCEKCGWDQALGNYATTYEPGTNRLTQNQREWLEHASAFLSINSGREGASACSSLAHRGLVERLPFGGYRITEAGRSLLRSIKGGERG